MDGTLFVLLTLMVSYLVLFLMSFSLGELATNSHDVIGIIITVIVIIFIVYIFNFDTAFGIISSCKIFGRIFGIYCRCVICCVRYDILFLRWGVTRVMISWILLLSIGCIVIVDIDYFHRFIFWHIYILDVIVIVSQLGRGGTFHTISVRGVMYNTGIGTGPSGHGDFIYHILICGCSIYLV